MTAWPMSVCKCGHMLYFPPPLKAAVAVSSAQSVRLCELKPAVGGIWAGRSPTEVICTERSGWNKSQASEKHLSVYRGVSVRDGVTDREEEVQSPACGLNKLNEFPFFLMDPSTTEIWKFWVSLTERRYFY